MEKTAAFNIKESSDSKKTLFNICLAIVFIVLISVTIVVRIRMLAAPLERDEGEYAYAGQLMLEGVPPYLLAYNMKMPGIYAAYAALIAIFGQTQSGIHFGVLVINTATIILIFILAKKLFGSIAGVAAAVFFAITSVSYRLQPTANAENFVVLPAVAGILLLMRFIEFKKLWHLIAGGLLLGVAFMMKQHGIGFILFCFILLFWNQVRQKPFNYKRIVSLSAIYSLSVIFPFLISCLILWWCGVFEKFWFWTFKYAHQYVSIVSYAEIFTRFKDALEKIGAFGSLIWWSALLGLLSCIWNAKIRRHGIFLIGLLVCSFIAISPGLYFRPHYFVLFLPVVVILAAAFIAAFQDLLNKFIKSEIKISFVSVLLIFVIWLHSFYVQRFYLVQGNPELVARFNFGFAAFPETLKIANFIKQNSDKNDKIAILGSEPQICFYAHRRSATSYIYTYPLMEPQQYAIEMHREMIKQIEDSKPRFIVLMKTVDSWAPRANSEKLIFNWADKYLSAYYKQIGLVEIFKKQMRTSYRWDAIAKPEQPEDWIMVLERIN